MRSIADCFARVRVWGWPVSDIVRRISAHVHALKSCTLKPDTETVIYLGRKEFYELLMAMRSDYAIHLDYPNEVRRVTCFGLEVIEVCLPKYLRVA